MKKIIRSTTISLSLNTFCKGILSEMKNLGYDVLAVSSPDEGLYDLAQHENVQVIGVPMERHISLTKDIKSLFQLYRVFIKEKPDMVHSMTPKAGLLSMMAGWMAGVPVRVHTFTGLVWPTESGLKRKILMATDWLTCACATHVIPEGYGVLEDLSKHITKKPMRVLGYGNVKGIDLTYWDKSNLKCKIENVKCKIDSDAASEGDAFTFLFVGRIVGDKGINELVSAFSRLLTQVKELRSERVKKCRLVLVGGYEEKLDPVSEETRRMIGEMPEIEAVGPQYGEDLKAWYAKADCFVFPSYREGFPNTVLEAGAMELASIVTDINGSREIIVEGVEREQCSEERGYDPNRRLKPGERMSVRENGVVIPSKDVEALYEAMSWMMEHEEERNRMGKRAREIVAERWEQGFVRQQLYHFYDEVLS